MTKLLSLYIRIFYSPDRDLREKSESESLLRRLKGQVGQFQTEHHMYHQTSFKYRGREMFYRIEEDLVKQGCLVQIPSERQQQLQQLGNKYDQQIK